MARVRAETGEGGAPSIRKLFGNEKNTKAILEFLEKTRVGKMPGRVLLAGGPSSEEEELEGFSLLVSGEEVETEVRAETRMGRALPSRMYPFLVSFPWCSTLFFGRARGEGEKGHLTITAQAGSR